MDWLCIFAVIERCQAIRNKADLCAMLVQMGGENWQTYGVPTRIATLEHADGKALGFLAQDKFLPKLMDTQACAVLVPAKFLQKVPQGVLPIVVADPYLAYACISQLFEAASSDGANGIHSTAQIHPTALLGAGVQVGAYCVIEAGAVIEEGSQLGSHVVVEEGAVVGKRCKLFAHVVVGRYCILGEDCRVHSGAVIGSEGFGFAKDKTCGHWERIAQLGNVRIGNRVRIGANVCIDRGAIEDTLIKDDVIIDNLVQIAHNVSIGQATAIAAQTGIAGSSHLGQDCIIGGAVGISGHLRIADGVTLTGRTFVIKSIDQAGVYSSGTVAMPNNAWRRAAAKFRQSGKDKPSKTQTDQTTTTQSINKEKK